MHGRRGLRPALQDFLCFFFFCFLCLGLYSCFFCLFVFFFSFDQEQNTLPSLRASLSPKLDSLRRLFFCSSPSALLSTKAQRRVGRRTVSAEFLEDVDAVALRCCWVLRGAMWCYVFCGFMLCANVARGVAAIWCGVWCYALLCCVVF